MGFNKFYFTKKKCLKCKKGKLCLASSLMFYCDTCGTWHYFDQHGQKKWRIYNQKKLEKEINNRS